MIAGGAGVAAAFVEKHDYSGTAVAIIFTISSTLAMVNYLPKILRISKPVKKRSDYLTEQFSLYSEAKTGER